MADDKPGERQERTGADEGPVTAGTAPKADHDGPGAAGATTSDVVFDDATETQKETDEEIGGEA